MARRRNSKAPFGEGPATGGSSEGQCGASTFLPDVRGGLPSCPQSVGLISHSILRNRDGGPQTSVVWIARDGDAVLFSTAAGRQKARNLARDPRVSLTVFDTENPYRSVDIRGTAELIEDREKSLSRTLSQKYLGEDPPTEPGEALRLIVRVTPQKITGFSV